MHAFRQHLRTHEVRRQAGAADLQAAVDAYNRDHAQDWGRAGGTCPICGHRGCFGSAGGKLGGSGRWACFSANHGNVGLKLEACFHGDALDVDAHSAGRTRVEHLRTVGYLQSRSRTRPRKAAPEPRESLHNRDGKGRASQRALPRKGTAVGAANEQEPQPLRREGPAVPTPVHGEGPGVPFAAVGEAELRPADPLRWSRPDAIEAFGREPTPDEIEALDERAGILEFDAGMTIQDAEREALLRASRREGARD